MLRPLKNNRAVILASEYLLVFFLVVGMISAMSVYFRRAVQARIRDARLEMVEIVKDRAGSASDGFVGNLWYEYEPYYANTVSNVTTDIRDTIFLEGGGSTGIFKREYDDDTSVVSSSITVPPEVSD